MMRPSLKPEAAQAQTLRACVLLPLPLKGPYDYAFVAAAVPRGTLVMAPLGGRQTLGVVWGAAEGGVADEKLKTARPLEGFPALPAKLCDFVDWVARYTLAPQGSVLSLALRATAAFAPEIPRVAYVRGAVTPTRMTLARARVLEVAGDGLARAIPALAEEANASASVVRGLIEAGALDAAGLPEFAPLPQPDPEFQTPALNPEQQHAAVALVGAVSAHKFSAHLLDGVTGSGKTETYFEAIAEALRRKRQV
ncbi:MAG TPA: hypothetical protein VL026_02430, partial [Rhizomicrobium sp.]|nr:hypothetical protein [Rhizomicrobium sp.]